MSAGRRSYEERVRRKLLDLWQGEDRFGSPVGCVASTYTFSAEQFEEQCLARFLDMQSDRTETPAAYAIEREEKLVECPAWVFVDQAYAGSTRSLRWSLLPVTVAGGGIQHAKISLLVWERTVRIIIASANLTQQGYRSNQECAAILDFGTDSELPASLLQECLAFIERLRDFAPGRGRDDAGPQRSLGVFLRRVRTWSEQLPVAGPTSAGVDLVALFPNSDSLSVLAQLSRLWHRRSGGQAAKLPAPDAARVLSPFYNEGDFVVEVADELEAIMAARGPRSINFQGPGSLRPDGVIEIGVPEPLKSATDRTMTHAFDWISEQPMVNGRPENRPLHAKSLWLQRGARALYMLGSSNFTLAGLGLRPGHNIELNVAYDLRDTASPFARMCARAMPDAQPIADLAMAQFKAGQAQDEDLPSSSRALPTAFGLALYRRRDGQASLEMEIAADAPVPFVVQSATGREITDATRWRVAGAPPRWVCEWGDPMPPSTLRLRWQGADGEFLKAHWIVNVANAMDLPPPHELHNLSLDELLEVLSSSRPLHQIIAAMLTRRTESTEDHRGIDDPLLKVDSSQFLLQRMRRVSRALEGLRARLSRPISTRDALDWRLDGPVGPLALARQLLAAEQHAAGFMIAEIATLLRDTPITTTGELQTEEIRIKIRSVLVELRQLAEAAPAPANLARYVDQTFMECLT